MTAVLDLLTQLVRARTVASGEGALASVCAELLRDNGFEVSMAAWEPGREQLVARNGVYAALYRKQLLEDELAAS